VIDADATVAALTVHSERTALLLDFDGSLSPIVELPQYARPLPEAPALLGRLAARFGRVAIISGRPIAFLAAQLPVEGLLFVGLYGLEQSLDGEYSADQRVEPYLAAVAAATAELEAQVPRDLVEPKSGISVVVHWRPAPERGAELAAIAREVAHRHGLDVLDARMAIELRPPIDVDKGVPVRGIVDGFDTAAFAGDDYGDLPAFAALALAVTDGRLQRAVRIGVTSSEAPPELAAAVDVVVDGPPGLLALLARVADALG
jgi:trehalose 6-phosphate phosphatase